MPETLDTQTAAPPVVPPQRRVVGTVIADDDDLSRFRERSERLRRDLLALRDRLDSANP
jgi:hypothetical protein